MSVTIFWAVDALIDDRWATVADCLDSEADALELIATLRRHRIEQHGGRVVPGYTDSPYRVRRYPWQPPQRR